MFFFDHEQRTGFRPKSLFDKEVGSLQNEILAYLKLPEKERMQTDVPPVWKYSFEPDVLTALSRLSYHKCPFCDTPTTALQAYRFRPPAHATPSKGVADKYSYLWLAFNWENLFPICQGCLPTDKSYFRVRGRRAYFDPLAPYVDPFLPGLHLDERPVLYYPGELKTPYKAFEINHRGELIQTSGRAPETLNQFKLNRPELVEARARAIREQRGLLRKKRVFSEEMKSLPAASFAGARYLFLVQLADQIGHRFGGNFAKSPDGIVTAYQTWFRSNIYDEAIEEGLLSFDEKGSETILQVAPTDPQAGTAPILISSSNQVSTLEGAGPQAPTSDAGLYSIRHPRLTQVRITNFKSLERIEFDIPAQLSDAERKLAMMEELSEVPAAPAVMILGENSTGKSSILEAIALACLPKDQRKGLELNPGRLTTNPSYMGAEVGKASKQPLRKSNVQLTFEDGKRFTLDIDQDGIRTASSGGRDPDGQPHLFAYGAHRLYGKAHRVDELRHVDTLFSDEKQISNPEAWLTRLSRERPEALNEVVSALRHIIQIDGRFEHIEVRRDEDDETDICLIKIVKERSDGTSYSLFQRLDVASSGYKAVLAVVCDILQKLMEEKKLEPHRARNAHAIVLIDEIEAHLHPRWKLQIVSGLRRALPGTTFLFTSHDPLCVRGMFSGEVMMLNRFQNAGSAKGGELPEVVERVSDFGNIGALTVEQLLTSDMFQLFSTDDRKTEIAFARVAEILAREEHEDLSQNDLDVLAEFRREIGDALPYGRTEVSRVVQEAVAEYLAQRRRSGADKIGDLRNKAKKEIKGFLKEILE
ncbi:AAA family ATPase [Roseibium sp.]|uniref:AAA family ATPase n=1 Tax=Roseibium sp. TaxID=1936156 RepID=UPI003A984A22